MDDVEVEEQVEETTETEMPVGNDVSGPIRTEQVTTTPGGANAPAFDDDASSKLIWDDYQVAKSYLETNSWILEWQAADILYQSPNYDRWTRVQDGRPVRISRFLVAKNSNTMNNQVHRGIFGNQKPFTLQPEGDTGELLLEAWTHLIWALMKRAKFEYNLGLLIESQCLQGTGIAQPGWQERPVTKKIRRRKTAEPSVNLPVSGPRTIPTKSSDDFEVVSIKTVESWPFFDFKRLGTVLFDPKWSTPNAPEESAGYVIDVDYVNFHDLQELRTLSCYKNIPEDAVLKGYFLDNNLGDAAPASMVAEQFTDKSSVVMHAAGEHKMTSTDPLMREIPLVTRWTAERAEAILCFSDRKLTIRNEEHDLGDHALHYTANWWNIPYAGYGMGIGRLNNGDQRMEQGVLNESLKMIAYPMNAPILYDASEGNAPTQNVIMGMGTFWGVRPGRDGNVGNAMQYMRTPEIPPEAWKFMQMAEAGGEDLVGANSTTMQGNLGGPGSSAMRTAAGVNRVGGKADDNISKPVRHLEWIIERFINFLIEMVKLKMPLEEIRRILSKKFAKAILDQIDVDQFLEAEFTINVLAGAKLIARQAIQQLIPFMLQIVQQPQLMDYSHQKGQTVDFAAMERLFIRMSELDGNDWIFRAMTPQEKQEYAQNNPGAQKLQSAIAVERQRGQNKVEEAGAKGQADVTTVLAKTAAEHAAGSVPLERAEGLLERTTDEHELASGIPDQVG